MDSNPSCPRELAERIKLIEKLQDGENATIYKERFGKTDIALKRVSKQFYDDIYARSLCQINHQNIVKVLFVVPENDWIYLAMDNYYYTLEEYVVKDSKTGSLEDTDRPEVPPRQRIKVLKQVTDGIHYLHSKKLVHGNLNPSIILFYEVDQQHEKWNVKISGLNQYIEVADDKVESDQKGKFQKDIFDLATIFYYTLRDGKHTFDNCAKELMKTGKDLNLTFREKRDDYTTKPLILSMVCVNVKEQISVEAVKKHYLFWSAAQTVLFLQSASNYIANSTNAELRTMINAGHEAVLDKKPSSINVWKAKIPKEHGAVHDALVKWGFTTKKTVCDLLRVIRNWSVHYYDGGTKAQMRKELGGDFPDGFNNFFSATYPKLLSHIYETMKCKKGELVFRKFYEVTEDDIPELEPDEEETPSEPSSPKKRIVVFGRTKGGIYHYDLSDIKLDKDSSKTKMPNPKGIKIGGTFELLGDNTLTAVSVGCRIYVITWIGHIFEADLSDKNPRWSEKTEKTLFLHGCFPPTAVIADCIYICGGGWQNGGDNEERGMELQRVSEKCEKYNTKEGSLKELPDLNQACRDNSVVAVGDKLYSIGGMAEVENLLNTIQVYDTKSVKIWNTLKARLLKPRHCASAVALGQMIFIIGGKVKERSGFNSCAHVEQYEIGKDECATIEPMSLRYGKFTACALDSKIYAVGRKSGSQGLKKEIWLDVFCSETWYKWELDQHIEPICLAMSF